MPVVVKRQTRSSSIVSHAHQFELSEISGIIPVRCESLALVRGLHLWNSLPVEVFSDGVPSLNMFKLFCKDKLSLYFHDKFSYLSTMDI